jgi:hypothetical protein
MDMEAQMSTRTGSLTVLSADKGEIYGEFADAEWTNEPTDVGERHIFSGVASDGTIDTFQRINQEGISHVNYRCETDGQHYKGRANLLAPITGSEPGSSIIQIESIENPH